MNRCWIILVAVMGAIAAAPAGAQDSPEKPNILIIMADDLGFADLGCYGGDIQTPTLDNLAEDGLRFTQFYNTGRCWTSRVSLMTGYYHDQIGTSRPSWARTLPQLLKPAGYRSYHAGKWHLGRWFEKPLADAGFDRSYSLADLGSYFLPKKHYLDDRPLPAVEREDGYYATKAKTDYMIKFLKEHAEQHADKPFFAYLTYTAPHAPLQAEQGDIDRYAEQYSDGWDARRARIFVKQKQLGLIDSDLSRLEPDLLAPGANEEQRSQLGPGEVPQALRWFELNSEQQAFQAQKMRVHAAMVDRMDREIGRIIFQLRRMRAYENTLILFMSDNGASAAITVSEDGHDPKAAPGSRGSFLSLGPGWASSSNTPFRRHKGWAHEGGIATPLIVHWRRMIDDEGEFRHEVGHFIDFMPTILKLAGLEPENPAEKAPKLPGVDLKPLVTGEGTYPKRELFFNQAGNRAYRQGKWKIVASSNERAWSLYDMSEDRAEEDNVGRQHPEKLLELTMLWERLNKDFEEDAQR